VLGDFTLLGLTFGKPALTDREGETKAYFIEIEPF
jgi:hypothetical protein